MRGRPRPAGDGRPCGRYSRPPARCPSMGGGRRSGKRDNTRTTPDARRTAIIRLPGAPGTRRDAEKPDRKDRAGGGAVPRRLRLRGDGHPAHRECHPRGAGHHLPGRTRAGEVAHHPLADHHCWTRPRPSLAGCEIPEDPFEPITRQGRDIIAEKGDAAELEWLDRDQRYGEKLATPDITIADLIGEVDPIKVAEGKYLSDELTIHYGLIPRTNRGIFCINELPDLAERIQVGLLNIMEERDVQIRGYRIRLPLDVFVVASANPEDYTNRGRIITPLKDRYGAQVRTHYPTKIEHEMDIMEAEHHPVPADFNVIVPPYMKEVIAEISRLARRSPDVNQRSGVSVRASIANYESMLANALRRVDHHERGRRSCRA